MARKPLKNKNGIELTIKQKLFCKEYLANGYNSKQAAINAGYKKKVLV
jgi:phage terminase small subunit